MRVTSPGKRRRLGGRKTGGEVYWGTLFGVFGFYGVLYWMNHLGFPGVRCCSGLSLFEDQRTADPVPWHRGLIRAPTQPAPSPQQATTDFAWTLGMEELLFKLSTNLILE